MNDVFAPKLDDDIRRLCAAAVAASCPSKLEIVLAQLRAALSERAKLGKAMVIQ